MMLEWHADKVGDGSDKASNIYHRVQKAYTALMPHG